MPIIAPDHLQRAVPAQDESHGTDLPLSGSTLSWEGGAVGAFLPVHRHTSCGWLPQIRDVVSSGIDVAVRNGLTVPLRDSVEVFNWTGTESRLSGRETGTRVSSNLLCVFQSCMCVRASV